MRTFFSVFRFLIIPFFSNLVVLCGLSDLEVCSHRGVEWVPHRAATGSHPLSAPPCPALPACRKGRDPLAVGEVTLTWRRRDGIAPHPSDPLRPGGAIRRLKQPKQPLA